MTSPHVFPMRRLKLVASLNDEALTEDTDLDFELRYIDIGNVDSTGRIHDVACYRFEAAPSRARRIVRDGDVIISTVRTYLEAIAPISNPPENLIVSTGFAVVRPNKGVLDPAFCKYVLREKRFMYEVVTRSTGISYPAINASDLADIALPIPPLDVQARIAELLEQETSRIGGLIAEKQRQLQLLAEKRRALITHAVTQGLNPDTPRRDSGIAWLGELPAHWPIKRLKFVADVRGGLTLGKDYGTQALQEFPYMRVANVQDGFLDLSKVITVMVPAAEAAAGMLENGDVLMNEGGDIDKLGRGCVWRMEIANCLHQNHVFCVRPFAINSDWLNAWTSTETAKRYFESRAKRATNLASISGSNIKELPVPLPPQPEQLAILRHIAVETTKLDELTNATERTIALLHERRSALISAAVSGQLEMDLSVEQALVA